MATFRICTQFRSKTLSHGFQVFVIQFITEGRAHSCRICLDSSSPEQVEQSSDVLYDFEIGGRRVVGLGDDMVVKYGANIDLDEATSR